MSVSGESGPPIQVPIRKIAIVRALHLGDLILAVPAFRALRERFPEAEITLVGLAWAKEFVQRFSAYLDRWVQFPGFPGMLEVEVDWSHTKEFLKASRAYDYDLAIQMHGDGSVSNKFTALLGARLSAGYRRPNLPSPKLTHSLPYPEGMKEVLKHLRLVELLGARSEDVSLEFPLNPSDFEELSRIPGASQLDGKNLIVTINPGARPPARRWYPERFAAVADWLVAEHAAMIVLCGGPGEEHLAQAVRANMRAKPIDLTGMTSIGALGALISKSSLAVLNDSGPAHAAAALGVPSVTLFGAADPRRWAPIDQTVNRIIYKGVDCSPCPHWVCPIDHRCMNWITVEEVREMANELLSSRKNTAGDDSREVASAPPGRGFGPKDSPMYTRGVRGPKDSPMYTKVYSVRRTPDSFGESACGPHSFGESACGPSRTGSRWDPIRCKSRTNRGWAGDSFGGVSPEIPPNRGGWGRPLPKGSPNLALGE